MNAVLTTVAALYVDPRGPYPLMPGVECWDAARDARNYAGPWPVVAHPPCGPWSRFSHFNIHQCKSLAPIAVEQVRAFGGVLEHPTASKLFRHCGLPFPNEWIADKFGGFTVEVDQCAFGHVARKNTWLYIVGANRARVVIELPRSKGTPTHRVARDRRRTARGELKECSAEQRRRTPPAFAEWLVSLARSVDSDARGAA